MMSYYEPPTRRIVVREASPRQVTEILTHELAHYFGAGTYSSPEEETLAQSVAYVICSHFGLDMGERSFPYIATRSRDAAVLKGAMARIQQVRGRIIERLEPPARTHESLCHDPTVLSHCATVVTQYCGVAGVPGIAKRLLTTPPFYSTVVAQYARIEVPQ
jgi:hypothetical protein